MSFEIDQNPNSEWYKRICDLYHLDLAVEPPHTFEIFSLLLQARLTEESFKEALPLAKQALEQSQKLGYALGEAWSWREIGSCYQDAVDLETARTYLLKALVAFQKLGEETGVASVSNILGIIENLCGNQVAAIKYYQVYLDVSKKLERYESYGIALANIAECYRELGDLWQALDLTLKAHQILSGFMHEENQSMAAWTLSNLGDLYRRLGQPQIALEQLQAALDQQILLKKDRDATQTMCYLGQTLVALEQFEAAKLRYEAGIQLAENCHEQIAKAWLQRALAELFVLEHQPARALALVTDALKIAEDLKLPEITALGQISVARTLLAMQPANIQSVLTLLETSLAWSKQAHALHLQREALEVRLCTEQLMENWFAALQTSLTLRQVEQEIASTGFTQRMQALQLQRDLEKHNATLEKRTIQLENLANQDALTGLWNRRGFEKIVQQNLELHHSFNVAMLDLDYLKTINDRWGHRIGDKVLLQLSQLMLEMIGSENTAARLSGDEFALLIEGSLHNAILLTQNLRLGFAKFDWATIEPGLSATISIGVTLALQNDTLERLLHRADQCLYAVKRGGRNAVAWRGQ